MHVRFSVGAYPELSFALHLQFVEASPFSYRRPRRTADGRISVCAHVLGKGRFYGIGRNYRLAKSLAAKRALRVLRKFQETT